MAELAEVERLSAWDQLPVPQRNQLLRQFVTQVTASKGEAGVTCEVTWRVAESPTGDGSDDTAAD